MYDLRNKKHALVYAIEVHKVEFCLYSSHSIVRLKHNQGNGNFDLMELGFGDMKWERFALLMCLSMEARNQEITHKFYYFFSLVM
jgi:hypothetical protein